MRIRLTVVALAWLGTVTAPATAAEPVEADIADWIAEIDAAPDWSAEFASLDYDRTTDTAVLTGLTVAHAPAGLRLDFQPISVSGYSESADGTFAADRIVSDGLTVAAAGLTANVSDIRLEGIGNLAKDFTGGVEWDAQRPFTSMLRTYSRFVDIRLAHGAIGAMSLVASADGDDVIVAYTNVAIDDWADGKIAAVSTGPVAIETVTPDGPVTMAIGGAAGHDFDYAAILRIYDPDQYVGGVGDRIWRSAAARVEYSDIAFAGPGARGTLASAAIEDFRVRQPRQPFHDFFDRAMRNPDPDLEPTPEELRAIFGYFSAFSVGAMTVRDMTIDADDGASGRLGGLTVRDVSSEGIGEFSIDEFTATKPGEGYVDIGRIAFGGLVFPPIEALLDAAEAETTGSAFDFTRLAGQLAFFEALAIDIDVADSPRLKLDKARLDLGNYVGAIPTLFALDIAGVDLPLSAVEDARLRSMWQALGYDRVSGDFSVRLAWNEADQSVAIDGFHLALDDVGAVSLDALLAGLDREALGDVEGLPAALIGLNFVGGSLALENYAILDRWIDRQAAATGTEPAQLRQQIAVLLTHMTADIGNSDFSRQLQRVVEASVMIPGSITATAAPAAPIPLAALLVVAQSAPASLPDLLGLTIAGSSVEAPDGRQ